MQNDEPNAGPTELTSPRKTLRLPLSSLNTMLRNAKWEARKAQARVNWIKSALAERKRENHKASEQRGDE